MLRILT